MRSIDMRFVFVPSKQECPAAPDGPGPVVEMRSIPGNLVGVGKTVAEAVASLVGLIAWTIEEEGEAIEDWYRESWSYADPGDDVTFGRSLTDEHRQLREPKKITVEIKVSGAPAAQGQRATEPARKAKEERPVRLRREAAYSLVDLVPAFQ